MATTTTNLGLSKPEYTDAADIAVINSNMDTLDSNSHTLAESIGKVVNGNKTAETNGIAIDEYVSLENSTITGRADGIYKASKAIPYNTAIDSTYLSPISGGLGGEVSSLNSKFSNVAEVCFTQNAESSNDITMNLSSLAEGHIYVAVGYRDLVFFVRESSTVVIIGQIQQQNVGYPPVVSGASLTMYVGSWGFEVKIYKLA